MKELHQIVSVTVIDDKRVRVAFENGVEGTFDCSSYMADKFWRRLADPAFFRLVRAEGGTLVWPGDIDIDPEEIWEDSVKDSPNPANAIAVPGAPGFFAAESPPRYNASSPSDSHPTG